MRERKGGRKKGRERERGKELRRAINEGGMEREREKGREGRREEKEREHWERGGSSHLHDGLSGVEIEQLHCHKVLQVAKLIHKISARGRREEGSNESTAHTHQHTHTPSISGHGWSAVASLLNCPYHWYGCACLLLALSNHLNWHLATTHPYMAGQL